MAVTESFLLLPNTQIVGFSPSHNYCDKERKPPSENDSAAHLFSAMLFSILFREQRGQAMYCPKITPLYISLGNTLLRVRERG